jgi:hypothetical protein
MDSGSFGCETRLVMIYLQLSTSFDCEEDINYNSPYRQQTKRKIVLLSIQTLDKCCLNVYQTRKKAKQGVINAFNRKNFVADAFSHWKPSLYHM